MSKNRSEWSSRTGFVLAAIGSAVGLGNIWRFPYTAASNGGGAFLIPYLVALLTAGIPILILEFAMGHRVKLSAPGAFKKLNSKYEVLGWFQTLITFFISTYYVVIAAWAMSYAAFALKKAWGQDPEGFLFNSYLQLTDSPLHLGGLNTKILIPLLIVWGINYIVIKLGIKDGLEKANKIFMPLLVISLLIIVVRGVTLPGAVDGLQYFFQPDFSKLSDPKVWLAAYGQIFYSLSICFSIMLAYSSYLPEDSDIVNNAFITALGNCSFSLISGIGVFSILGYMAYSQGVGVAEVSSAGVGLAFVVFPKAINALPGISSTIVGVTFFMSLIFAGLSSTISIIEPIIAAISDKFNVTRKQALVTFIALAAPLSLIVATKGGLYVLDIVDYSTNQYGIIIAGIIELVILGWFFNTESIRRYANNLSDFSVGSWWTVCIRLASVILSIMLVLKVVNEVKSPYGGYSWTVLGIYGVGVMAAMIIGAFLLTSKRGSQRFEESITADPVGREI